MNGSTVALIGTGDLGKWALEMLVRSKGIRKIYVFEIDEERGKQTAFCAWAGASYFGKIPEVDFQKIDLHNIEQSAEIFSKAKPDVIVNCTTLMSWWVRQLLPAEIYRKLEAAGSGPWIPLHMTLTRKLMMAIKAASLPVSVVNTCFPDGVNPALKAVGLAPTIGGGNSDLLTPGIKRIVAQQMRVPVDRISTFLIAHHFHVMSLILERSTGGAPYFLKIMLEDKDITEKIDIEKVLVEAVELFPPGNSNHPMIASSFVKNALAIVNDTGELTHAAGPDGLPGGWPVRLSAEGAEVVLPQELGLSEALKIVKGAQKFDGIEDIKNDGTIVLTDTAYSTMKEMFGYDCKAFTPEESEERAKELFTRFEEYKNKF